MLRKALLAATALVAVQFCAPAPARAEPISTAIGLTTAISSALGVTAATAGAIGGTLIGTTISLGLSLLSQALSPKPKAGETSTGLETSVQLGGDVARQIPVGRCSLKGQLAYVNTYGVDNSSMHQVFVLSDWPTGGLVEMMLGGKKYVPQQVSTGQGWTSYRLAEFADRIAIWYYDGTQTAASPELVETANPAGRWTVNSRLSGLSYVIVGYVYDQYSDLYADGIPQWSFVVDGAKLYDRRQDSSVGGLGPQRWSDPATWAYSANPAVVRENYLRGFWRNDQLLLGMGVPAYDLVGESFAASANAADEVVPLASGGAEPRYRVAAVLSADDGVTHKSVLDAINASDAGYIYEAAGLYVCQAGVAQGVVRTVTDDDLLIGEAVTYAAKRSRAELVNKIYGQFLDPASGWQPQSYTPRISTGDVAIDGEELGKSLDLLSIASQSQAERVAEVRRREARAQATGAISLGYQHRDLIPGDWIRWTSARFAFSKVFRIAEREVRQASKAVRLSLEETGASVYGWGTDDEGPPVPAPIRPGIPLLPTTVDGFDVQGFQAASVDGKSEIPGIRATWVPVTDPRVDEVVIQLRAVGTTEIIAFLDPTPGDGEYVTIGGLLPNTDYEARATIHTTPLRMTTFTLWRPVRTGEARYDIDLSAIEDNLKAGIDAARKLAEQAYARSVDDEVYQILLQQLHESMGTLQARYAKATTSQSETIEESGRVVTETSRSLVSLSNLSQARYVELIQAIATGDAATVAMIVAMEAVINDPVTGLPKTRAEFLDFHQVQVTTNTAVSQSLTQHEAQIGGNTATITANNNASVTRDNALSTSVIQAQATADGATAMGRFAIQARAGSNGTDVVLALVASRTSGGSVVDAGIYIVIDQAGQSRVVMDVDKFQVGSLNGADFPFEFVNGTLRVRNLVVTNQMIASNAVYKSVRADVASAQGTLGGTVEITGLTRTFTADHAGKMKILSHLTYYMGSGSGAGSNMRLDIRVNGITVASAATGAYTSSDAFTYSSMAVAAGQTITIQVFLTGNLGSGAPSGDFQVQGGYYDVDLFYYGGA